MLFKSLLSTLLILPMMAACSSDPGGGGGGGGGGDGTDAAPGTVDADTSGGGGGDSFSVTWGPKEVPAGEEKTFCVIQRLGNDAKVHIGEITNTLGDASHHFIVYRISEGEVTDTPFSCDPFAGTLDPSKGAPLMVTQKQEETLTFPDGVAITLEPGQLIRLELHYLNATGETQNVSATSTFKTISDDKFEYEADFLFIGNPDITLPPRLSTSLVTNFLPLPDELMGANIFGITGHTHQWGTNVEVGMKIGESGTPTMLYEVSPFNWDEPETIRLDPPAVVQPGSGFSFTCDWDNQSDSEVGFGEAVKDEMCFFWAYYYPSVGPRVCVHSEQGNQLGITDLCCPGNALCALLDGVTPPPQ